MKDTIQEIIIGSRASQLALIQSEMVKAHIEETHPEISVRILPLKTTGDRILDRSLDKIGGKGLFVKELDVALLNGQSQLSVHSLKDVPMEVDSRLPLVAFSRREDPRDVLVLPRGAKEIDFSKPIGCSSKRRMVQFLQLYPQATFAPIRGNVQTRLAKLDGGAYGATLLAAAGLKRLGLEERISRYFSPEEMIPAAGQGILAVQGVLGGDVSLLAGYGDEESLLCATAERAFVGALGAGCSAPVAAYGQLRDGRLHLLGMYQDEFGGQCFRGSISGDPREAKALGEALARDFLSGMHRKEQTD